MHGIMGHSREWDVLTRALAGQYRVVAIDLPGHGDSLDTEFGAQIDPGVHRGARLHLVRPCGGGGRRMAGGQSQGTPIAHATLRRALPGSPADGQLTWRFDARGLARFPVHEVAGRLWDAINMIIVPTLLIRAGSSEILAPATARTMIERLQNGTLVEIAGAGHDLGVEQPEAVAAEALPFLATTR